MKQHINNFKNQFITIYSQTVNHLSLKMSTICIASFHLSILEVTDQHILAHKAAFEDFHRRLKMPLQFGFSIG